MVQIRRKSLFLENNNRKLLDELGSKNIQFKLKIQQEGALQKKINSLTQQNEDLYKKIKFYQTQIEKWKDKYNALEAKRSQESPKKKLINIKRFDETDKKKSSPKKDKKKINKNNNINQTEEKNDSDVEYYRFNTYSNLNDLLGSDEVSESESNNEDKEKEDNLANNNQINKKNDKKIFTKKKIKSNFRKYSFDLEYFFETKVNTYENFCL